MRSFATVPKRELIHQIGWVSDETVGSATPVAWLRVFGLSHDDDPTVAVLSIPMVTLQYQISIIILVPQPTNFMSERGFRMKNAVQ